MNDVKRLVDDVAHEEYERWLARDAYFSVAEWLDYYRHELRRVEEARRWLVERRERATLVRAHDAWTNEGGAT